MSSCWSLRLVASWQISTQDNKINKQNTEQTWGGGGAHRRFGESVILCHTESNTVFWWGGGRAGSLPRHGTRGKEAKARQQSFRAYNLWGDLSYCRLFCLLQVKSKEFRRTFKDSEDSERWRAELYKGLGRGARR